MKTLVTAGLLSLILACTGGQGPQGDTGPRGEPGPQGDPGVAGTPGQSVSVATEVPGIHCPAGGQKFSSASGTHYICNGSAPSVAHMRGADFPVGSFDAGTHLPVDFTASPYPSDLSGADFTGDRFVVPSAGLYSITGFANFCPQTTHYTSIHLKRNGTLIAFDNSPVANGCRTNQAHLTFMLEQGDILTMEVFDSANGPITGIGNILLTVVKLR